MKLFSRLEVAQTPLVQSFFNRDFIGIAKVVQGLNKTFFFRPEI